jgi:hypothetical protein
MLGAMDSMSNTNGIEELPILAQPEFDGSQDSKVAEMGNGLGTMSIEMSEPTFGDFADTMDQLSPRIQPDGNVQYVDEYRFDITGNAMLPFLKKIASLVDEAQVTMDKDGWHVKVVDPAHVAMFEVTLPCERFWNYDKSLASQVVDIGLPIEYLESIFKKMGAKDRKNAITIDIVQDKNKIRILSGASWIEYNLVDTTGMSNPKVPKLALPAEITFETLEPLSKWFKMAREVSDHVSFSLEPGKETLHCVAESERVVKAMLDERMEANSGVYLVRAQGEYSDMENQLMSAGID